MSEYGGGPQGQGSDINLSLVVTDEAEAHTAFDRLADGGRVLHPLETAPWGALFGELVDRFGVRWLLSTSPD
jgi:PhnB protein